MNAPNPFDVYAEAVKPQWQRGRENCVAKAAQTRARTKAEKQLDEDEVLERLWRAGKKQQRIELMTGPHGKDIKGLMTFLRIMTLSSAPALITLIERATWIRTAPEDVRHAVLEIVARGIGDLRVKEGFERFDDALWDEPPRAFHVIKNLVGVR
jgi:hypothetical protein